MAAMQLLCSERTRTTADTLSATSASHVTREKEEEEDEIKHKEPQQQLQPLEFIKMPEPASKT